MRVSKTFSADFDLVTEYFFCPPDKIEEMRAIVRANFEVWEEQITYTANKIRLRSKDVTERIKAKIALEMP